VKGDNNADSDTRQRTAIEAYAASYGMTIAAEFYDAAVSGADPVLERDGFRDMLDKCNISDDNVTPFPGPCSKPSVASALVYQCP